MIAPSPPPFIFILAVLLAGVPFTHVQTSSAQDLPDLDDIKSAIEEARNIVARAGECTLIADDATAHATLARLAAKETTGYRNQAGASRMLAEKAADAAEAAAVAAETAAVQAQAAADLSSGLAAAAPDEGSVPPDRDQEKQALRQALAAAAAAAADAAGKAEEAAAAARQAIADAMMAASTAEDAATESTAADAAAMRAMLAVARAQVAAAAAKEAARGYSADDVVVEVDAAGEPSVNDVAAAAKAAAGALGQALSWQTEAKSAAGNAASSKTNAEHYAEDASAAAADAKAHAARAEQCATEVSERESTLATARAASVYVSRAVVNRVQKLRPVGQTSFGSVVLSPGGMTGINAGEDVLPDYPPNLAVDIGYSRSQDGRGLFDARSNYVLFLTDRLLTTKRLFGFGAGMEYTREFLLGGVDRRTRGITATAYLAQILTEDITLVPQAAVTYLDKNSETTDRSEDNKAIRGLGSLTVLWLNQRGGMELSAFGQFAYMHEEPVGSSSDDAVYLGQAIGGGEAAFAVWADAHLFVGASLGYDVVRSVASGGRLGYGGNLGLRSRLGATTEFSLSLAANRQDEEETLAGNVLVKVFF